MGLKLLVVTHEKINVVSRVFVCLALKKVISKKNEKLENTMTVLYTHVIDVGTLDQFLKNQKSSGYGGISMKF